MTALKANFLNPWDLAISISNHDILKNFFYMSKTDRKDKNIFFNDSIMYNNSDELLQQQLKQNVNLYIELKGKRVLCRELDNDSTEYDLQTKYKGVATLDLVVFTYNPIEQVDKSAYIADISDNIYTKLDYFEYVCRFIENTYHVTDPIDWTGDKEGKAIIERKYTTDILYEDIIQEKDLEKANFYLDKIENVKYK